MRKLNATPLLKIGRKELKFNLDNLIFKKSSMIDYLNLKINEQDWHGVADAAMDLREIESELTIYSNLYARCK